MFGVAIGAGGGVAVSGGDGLAVDAGFDIFGLLVVASAARLRQFRKMQG